MAKHTAPSPQSSPTFAESFGFAGEGLTWVWQTQRNFRIHTAIFTLMVLTGLWIQLTFTEWAIVLTISAVVFTCEIINSALEESVNWVTNICCNGQRTPQAKAIKDASAGACLLASFFAVGVGLAVFGPKFWLLITP